MNIHRTKVFKCSEPINEPSWLKQDFDLIREQLKIGIFHYGPRMWRVGEITPLKDLQTDDKRDAVIERILSEFPDRILEHPTTFYRLRKNPFSPMIYSEYDSPPDDCIGKGRLDSKALPVLYGSQDLEICIHECRVTIEDDLYLSTLEFLKNSLTYDYGFGPAGF